MRLTRRPFPAPVPVLLAVLSLVAAACGGGGEATDASGTDTESAAVTDAGASGEWPDSLVFAAVPAEQNERLQESYKTTIDILESELGLDIEFFQAADYAGVIEAMIAGRVDLAQFGPFSYVIAKGNGANIEAIASMVSEPGAEPGYQSYAITQADNAEIDGLEDFTGKKVCFVDPSSTSGYLYPSAGLLEEGIDPEKDVQGVFAGGHDASAISVANGDCEAGFAFDTMVDKELIESGDLQEGDLKVVWKSEVIAGSPVAINLDLPEDLRQEIAELFVENVNTDWAVENGYCESAENCSFSDEGNYGYAAVDDSFFDGVRKVCEVTKSAQCEGVG